ncbi:MAG: hypothetical protein JO062_16445 [Bryobacterales bacterium]|nr:hypothetical protein [Bryobacterales bacterium]
MWRLLLTGILTFGLHAQPEADSVLAQIKNHMVETLARQPNYTCLETVERSRRDGSTRKFRLQDTLRIEVALVDGKEMFAWPGSKQFEDRDFRELIPTGTFGTGDFALHARSVFGGNSPVYQPQGEQKLDGRPAVQYDFRVARQRSGYQIRTRDAEAVIGYHGSFYVDPQSFDLMRLEVVGDDLPSQLKLKAIWDRMDYAHLRIGDGDFLLPDSSEIVVIDLNGEESRNRVRFSACHQYAGRSTLSFEDPDPAAGTPAPVSKAELELPANLDLMLSLVDEIDTDKAAIGDPVRAQLTGDLKWKGHLLAPKGATASGRISRVERHPNFTLLGVIFSELESATFHARLDLSFDRVAGVDTLKPGRDWLMNTPPLDHEGLVPLKAGRVRVLRGTLMVWRT